MCLCSLSRGLLPAQDPTGEAAAQAQKHLTYYELDLGLNHVVRKWSEPVDNGSNLLIAVPGGGDGPGGVLVCADNFVIYKDQDHDEVRPEFRVAPHPERGVLRLLSCDPPGTLNEGCSGFGAATHPEP